MACGLLAAAPLPAAGLQDPDSSAGGNDAPGVQATDTGATGQAPPVEALLDSIGDLDDAITLIDEFVDSISGDDQRLLLERRQVRLGTRRALLWRAAEAVEDEPDTDSGALVDSLLAADAQLQRDHVRELTAESSALRGGLSDDPTADRVAIDARVAELDAQIVETLADYNQTVEHRAALGADLAESLASLDAELTIRAEVMAARMAATESEVARLRSRMQRGQADLEPEARALGSRLDAEADALSGLLDIMDARELETSSYRQYLLITTGDLNVQTLTWDVVRSVAADWVGRLGGWVRANGPDALFKLLLFIGVLALFHFIARLVKRGMERAVQKPHVRLTGLMKRTLVRWTTRLVMFLGLIIALSQIGLELGPVLAGFGVAGFIVGFALQDVLSNFAAGVMILIYRPFDVGDTVQVAGVVGTISNLSLVSTTVLSLDNQRYVVPNNRIWGDVIQNVTALSTRRVDLVFGIGYDDDIAHAERILTEVIHGHELVLDDPAPIIRVGTLGASSVDLIARPWCRTEDYWEVYWGLTKAVKIRFDEERISIPFPQRDVHVIPASLGDMETALGQRAERDSDPDDSADRASGTPTLESAEHAAEGSQSDD